MAHRSPPLATYRSKRDFSTSPEPAGRVRSGRRRSADEPAELRFCVQKHLASHLHYDLRLEHGGVLLSWAVPKGPSLNPRDKRLAMRVEDHPREYGDFEGVIPSGYGAGIVLLWDRGTWEPLNGPVDRALKQGELKFRLHGVKLQGSWVLVRTKSEKQWLLIKHRDEWSGTVDVTAIAPQSVKSFGDLADILAAEKPQQWESHLPHRGGASGKMLQEVIAQAARRIAAKQRTGRRRGDQATRERAAKPPRVSQASRAKSTKRSRSTAL